MRYVVAYNGMFFYELRQLLQPCWTVITPPQVPLDAADRVEVVPQAQGLLGCHRPAPGQQQRRGGDEREGELFGCVHVGLLLVVRLP